MATYSHFYKLPVYKVCRAFRKKISSTAKKHFSQVRRLPFKSTDIKLKPVDNSQHSGGIWKVSLPGKYSVLPAVEKFAGRDPGAHDHGL
jgi:hypothetical protein